MRKIYFILFLLIVISQRTDAQIFVSPSGNDANSGSIELPLKTISKAVGIAEAGDTIYVREGTYKLNSAISIPSSKSGTESGRHYLFAYKNERPVFDFSGESSGAKGILLNASYWYIKGFEIMKAGDNGMQISGGSHNIIEFCSFYENKDSGLQLSDGASHNQIINCDSYYNADPPDYGDADGFAPKLNVGTGNYFYGCRAWGNCDDGWDGYMRGATDVTTTLENCWTFGNGYLKDGTDPGAKANGNGFKMGGGDNSNGLHLMHHQILKNCLAFNNKVKGFDQNNNDGSMTLLNCTGFNNKSANFRITRQVNAGQTVTVKNCISLNGNVDLGNFIVQQTNGWMSQFAITAADFKSINPSSATASRKADGSLPDIDFMHLAQGSGLIDAGVDVGLPFTGSAPDLGAFEFGLTTSVNENKILEAFVLYQNYPNPFNPETTIKFSIPFAASMDVETGHPAMAGQVAPSLRAVSLKVYDVLGREIATLVNENKPAGNYSVSFKASEFPSGIYFYKLTAGDYSATKKMILLK